MRPGHTFWLTRKIGKCGTTSLVIVNDPRPAQHKTSLRPQGQAFSLNFSSSRSTCNLWKIGQPSKINPPPFFEWSCCKGCFSLESMPTYLYHSLCRYVKQEAPTMLRPFQLLNRFPGLFLSAWKINVILVSIPHTAFTFLESQNSKLKVFCTCVGKHVVHDTRSADLKKFQSNSPSIVKQK